MTAIKGKIVIQGELKTTSPLHIGCGSDQRSDMDILLDRDGTPFIPATSLIGVLRHTIKTGDKTKEDYFWGYAKDKDGRQSAIRCSDLICQTNTKKLIRDGIKIDNKTGMVEHQGKYDYEILERGAVFSPLNMEFTYTHEDEDVVKRMAATIYDLLQKGHLQLGAKTNNGLGKIELVKSCIYEFDFSNKRDVLHWLSRKFLNSIPVQSLGKPYPTASNSFRMDITLELKNSLIIRSYPGDPELPDAVHIKSLDDWVLTGSSLKGALRARAERIEKTILNSDTIVKKLFGFVDKNKTGKGSAKKGKVHVHEIVLPKFISELQNRIKIDRFTGGTIEGALFDSMPLFRDDGHKVVNIIIESTQCEPREAGLMLLVLKDLWTGDLAVGGEKNVGRGVFKGTKAFIEWNNEKFVIDGNWSKMPSDTKNKLQLLVTALHQER